MESSHTSAVSQLRKVFVALSIEQILAIWCQVSEGPLEIRGASEE
jgi:hypothetical protein